MPNLKANGIHLEYEEFGNPADRPVLLIMGLGAQMILWRDDFCQSLAARGHRVIRFDNRDVGKSTWFDHLEVPDVMATMTAALTGQPIQAPYLLKDMAADAAGLLDGLGIERAHVVGASMGGMIAQSLAIEHPAKVISLTSIMSTTGNLSMLQPQPEALGVLLTPQPTSREAAIERGVMVFRIIGSPGMFDEQEIRELATQSYDRGMNPAGVMRQLVAILGSGSRNEALRKLQVPALVIHGKVDPLVPFAAGEDTAASIPSAELLAIDGMGHDMPRPLWPRIIDAVTELTERAS
jgi:pimeloyl-ACP methyl ester carboxylesterase